MNVRGLFMNKKFILASTGLLLVGVATTAIASGGETAAHAGAHADNGVLLKDFLYRCFNFVVTFGLLGYFVTKPIRKGLAGRREGIEKALEEAKVSQQKAEAKFAEYGEKLTKASAEIDEIYESIKREAKLEREKILANAHEMAQKIENEAKLSAAQEISSARTLLRREASAMAISIAEDILKKNFTGQDQSRLVDEYMQKVGELH